jgi:hypothetical protein
MDLVTKFNCLNRFFQSQNQCNQMWGKGDAVSAAHVRKASKMLPTEEPVHQIDLGYSNTELQRITLPSTFHIKVSCIVSVHGSQVLLLFRSNSNCMSIWNSMGTL